MATAFDAAVGFDSALVGFDGADLTPVQFTPDDLRVELFLKSPPLWSEATSRVRIDEGVRITRGRTSEDGESSASSCSLTFDNTLGQFNPRNTAGALYGRIGRNTPIRVGFGKPAQGETTTGTGTTLTYAQVEGAIGWGATAVAAVGVVTPTDNLTTPAGYVGAVETDAAAFTVGRYRTTDSDLLPSATSTASGSPTGWATAHVAIPGATYVTGGVQTADAGASPAGIGVGGLTVGDLILAVVTWSSDPYGRMGPPYQVNSTDHAEMYLVCDSGPSSGPRIAVWAWEQRAGHVGVGAFGADDGVTGASLWVMQYTGQAKYTPRFTGEVSDWPVRWNEHEGNKTVSIEAAGVQRRLAQQDAPSMMRAAFGTQGDLSHYWPLEDPEGATDFAQAVGGTRGVPVAGIDAGSVDAIVGSYPTPSFTGRGFKGVVNPANSAPWGFGGVVSIPTAGTAGGNNLLFGQCLHTTLGTDVASFGVEYTNSTTLTAKVQYVDGTTASSAMSMATTFYDGLLGRQVMLYVAMTQSGADVGWGVTVINVTPGEALVQTTFNTGSPFVGHVVGALASVTAGVEANGTCSGTNDVTVGHVFVTAGATFTGAIYRMYAARGYAAATNTPAMWAQSLDARVPITFTSNPLTALNPGVDTIDLSQLANDTPIGRMRALAVNGQGLLHDAAGFAGVEYRPNSLIISRPAEYTFDYNNATFAFLAPVDDDAATMNDVTVTARSGAQARVVVETGALGAQASGAGRYSATVDSPVKSPAAARDLAGWLAAQGTTDLARWPMVSLRMSGAGNASWATSRFSIGDSVKLTNLPSFTGPATVNLVVVGLMEEVDAALWTVTLVTRPAELYRVLVWDNATYGVWADSAAPATTDNRWGL